MICGVCCTLIFAVVVVIGVCQFFLFGSDILLLLSAKSTLLFISLHSCAQFRCAFACALFLLLKGDWLVQLAVTLWLRFAFILFITTCTWASLGRKGAITATSFVCASKCVCSLEADGKLFS